MIRILGFRRVLILSVLAVLNVAFAAGIYYYLMPQATSYEQQLAATKGQVSTIQSDIQKLLIEFEQLEEQQGQFNMLKERGFLSSQGRRQAEIVFGKVQQQSRVVSAVANVRAANVEPSEIAAKAGYTMLVSPIEVKIEAMEDIDIYRYLTILSSQFPGHIAMDNITMKRMIDVSNPVLRGIATGESVPLVSAEFKMSWRTMISQEDADRIVDAAEQQGNKK